MATPTRVADDYEARVVEHVAKNVFSCGCGADFRQQERYYVGPVVRLTPVDGIAPGDHVWSQVYIACGHCNALHWFDAEALGCLEQSGKR